jgi:hypothetical protein
LLSEELRELLEMAVECLRRDGKKGNRLWEDFMCATTTTRLL